MSGAGCANSLRIAAKGKKMKLARVEAINNWLFSNGLERLELESVKLLAGGRSNMTYEGVIDDTSSVIIRVAPPSAGFGRVEREFGILQGLERTGVSTPAVYGICDDSKVVGGYFFVMEKLPGVHPGAIDWDEHAGSAHVLWRSLGHKLADVHRVDTSNVGLGDLWRPGSYVDRQVSTWQKKLDTLETSSASEVVRLGKHLRERRPMSHSSPSLLHGDYKIENVLLDPYSHEVSGILDWELASFGDPMADLAWLRIWSPGQDDERIWVEPPLSQVYDLGDSGPVAEAYAEIGEVDWGSLAFHETFSYWKLSAINLMTEQRFAAGEMSGKTIDADRLRQQIDWQIDAVRQWAS